MSSPLTAETSRALMQLSQVKQPNAAMTKNQERIQESAKDFEAVFVAEMMKPMFKGIETDKLFGGGKGEEIFRGMMVQEYGKNIASLDVIGIQSQVQSKLIELQAAQSAQNSAPPMGQNKQTIDLDIIEQE